MNHEDSQMMKILETIADRLVDMHLSNNRRFDELAAQIESRLPAKAGEQLSLLAIVTAPEAVVPNEDEAMPVLASCPTCKLTATTDADVESLFGYRTPAGDETIVQSWCRECRKLEQATSPRKSPTYWSKMCPIAKAHNKTVQSARKMQKLLKAKLATKLSPSERAATESRLAAEQQVESEHKGYYNDQLKVLGYVHPNKAKRAAAKAAKAAK